MSDPIFSILLPTHHRPETLELAIQSVLAQTHEDWELLIIGDGCTDNTAEVVTQHTDSRIRWFDFPKAPGFGYANRNLALNEARGGIIAMVSHDNILLPDHLALLEKPFRLDAVQFVYSRPLWVNNAGLLMPFFFNHNVPACNTLFMKVRNVLPANCVAHRRECLHRVGNWPENIKSAGDWDLWKRIINDCGLKHIRSVRDVTCLHFCANWRDPGKWAPPPVKYYESIHNAGGFWPSQLNLNFNSELLPQKQAFDMLVQNSARFSNRIRTGCSVLEDMLAWQASLNPHFPS